MNNVVSYNTFKARQDARELEKTLQDVDEVELDVVHAFNRCAVCGGGGIIYWDGTARICPTCDGNGL